MRWAISYRNDPKARVIADRHYNRQSVGAPGFVPPGRCVVLLHRDENALWITSWPFPEFVHHAWPGAWVCSAFRNESPDLSSELILEAIAATRSIWEPPPLGMVTFVNPAKVRRKRDPGRCFLRAGFKPVGATRRRGYLAFQLLPENMPQPNPPLGVPRRLFASADQLVLS